MACKLLPEKAGEFQVISSILGHGSLFTLLSV
jgi:hypothetical protein